MPDTMITTADTTEALSKSKPISALLQEYRDSRHALEEALRRLEPTSDSDTPENVVAREQAHAPNDTAREALIEAPVASLEDIAAKLRFLFEVGGGTFDPSGWEGRIARNVLRDIEAAKVAPPTVSPSSFVEQVIEAVLPFVDGDDRKEGVTDGQIVEALKPLFGGFTVRDAVIAHFMMEPDSNTDADDCEGDNPRKHALYEAREAIINFITNADASSPECAVTRIYLAEHEEDDIDSAPHSNLHKVMQRDVKHVRTGRFNGDRFADTHPRFVDAYRSVIGWMPWSMIDKPEPVSMAAE